MLRKDRWKYLANAIYVTVFATAITCSQKAVAQTRVSLELVLAVDTSLSVNDREYALQMQGIANAFRSPEIINIISLQNGVAVSVIQWAGWSNDEPTVPWTLLTSEKSVLDFARAIEEAPRQNVGNFTAIGTAIEASLASISGNQYAGEFLKVDISGDGTNNAGPLPQTSRKLAKVQGVTINGLAIMTDVDALDRYYNDLVISGPGAFVVRAENYEDFARAIKLKIARELAPPTSENQVPQNSRKRFAGIVGRAIAVDGP